MTAQTLLNRREVEDAPVQIVVRIVLTGVCQKIEKTFLKFTVGSDKKGGRGNVSRLVASSLALGGTAS